MTVEYEYVLGRLDCSVFIMINKTRKVPVMGELYKSVVIFPHFWVGRHTPDGVTHYKSCCLKSIPLFYFAASMRIG